MKIKRGKEENFLNHKFFSEPITIIPLKNNNINKKKLYFFFLDTFFPTILTHQKNTPNFSSHSNSPPPSPPFSPLLPPSPPFPYTNNNKNNKNKTKQKKTLQQLRKRNKTNSQNTHPKSHPKNHQIPRPLNLPINNNANNRSNNSRTKGNNRKRYTQSQLRIRNKKEHLSNSPHHSTHHSRDDNLGVHSRIIFCDSNINEKPHSTSQKNPQKLRKYIINSIHRMTRQTLSNSMIRRSKRTPIGQPHQQRHSKPHIPLILPKNTLNRPLRINPSFHLLKIRLGFLPSHHSLQITTPRISRGCHHSLSTTTVHLGQRTIITLCKSSTLNHQRARFFPILPIGSRFNKPKNHHRHQRQRKTNIIQHRNPHNSHLRPKKTKSPRHPPHRQISQPPHQHPHPKTY